MGSIRSDSGGSANAEIAEHTTEHSAFLFFDLNVYYFLVLVVAAVALDGG